MGAHAYIEAEDLGLSILGTVQCSYTVNNVHRQDFDTAVYRASLCRSVALEDAMSSYANLIRLRQQKLDDLGAGLAELNRTMATRDKEGTEDKLTMNRSVANMLRRYGFSSAETKIKVKDLMTLIQNVQYAMDQEDNELQQDMTMLQSYVSKRDDATQMAAKFMKRIANTRQKGIKYIGS